MLALMIALTIVAQSGCGGRDEAGRKKTGESMPVQAATSPRVEWSFMLGAKLPGNMALYEKEILVADSIGNLLAVSVKDGSQRKAIHYPGPVMGWDIRDDAVAASTITKKLHFGDVTTGEELWSVSCETTPSEPAITTEGVIFSEGLGPYRVRFYSFEGLKIWEREFDVKPSGFSPTYSGDAAYIAFEDRTIRALKLDKGDTLWEFSVGKPLELAEDGRWAGRYEFLGVEGDEKARRSPFYIGGVGRMAIAGAGLIVPSEDGYVRCIDFTKGEMKWASRFEDRITCLWGSTSQSALIYVETVEGHFACMDTMTGDILGDALLENPTLGMIPLENGEIIVDVDIFKKPLLRGVPSLVETGILDIVIIPEDGMRVGDMLVVRTRDGEIAGISIPGD